IFRPRILPASFGAAEQNLVAAIGESHLSTVVDRAIGGHNARKAAMLGIGIGKADQAKFAAIGNAFLLVPPLLHTLRDELLPQAKVHGPAVLERGLRDFTVRIRAAGIEVHGLGFIGVEFER